MNIDRATSKIIHHVVTGKVDVRDQDRKVYK